MSTTARGGEARLSTGPDLGVGDTGNRVDFVDDLRTLAVVFMVMLHTLHGWLLPEMRTGALWTLVRLAGGLAAPAFFFLAGAGVALRVHADRAREVPPDATMGRLLLRGAIIMALGVGLRLSMWLVDSHGVIRADSWRVMLPASVGIAALVMAHGGRGPARQRAATVAAGGAVLLAVASSQVAALDPEGLSAVLRGDVLGALGACIAAVALLTRLPIVLSQPWLLMVAAAMLALATPDIGSLAGTTLSPRLAGYLVAGPGTAHEPFPLIPWVAHALGGGAVGVWWIRARARQDLPTTLAALAALGALCALLTSEHLPACYRALAAVPAAVPAARALSRFGLVLVLSGAVALVPKLLAPFRPLGRASLLAYWLHLPFAFGLPSRPLAHALTPGQWGLAFAVLIVVLLAITSILSRTGAARHDRTRQEATNRSSPLRTKQAVL